MSPTLQKASDPSASFEIEEILGVFADWEEIMRCALASTARVKDQLRGLHCPYLTERERLVNRLLRDKAPSAKIIAAIAADPAPEIRALLAAYELTPAKVLTAFVHDPSEMVREQLAGNEATPPPALASLTHDSSLDVVLAAAAATHLDPTEVDRLSQHPLSPVRSAIAQRNDLTQTLTHRLANDQSDDVVVALLQTAAKDPKTLGIITSFAEKDLRKRLITHPEASSVVIAGFFADPEEALRDRARSQNMAFTQAPSPLHPSNSLAVLPPGTTPTGQDPTHQPLAPAAIYWMLDADCPSPSVFIAAANPEMPLHLRLAVLARHDVPADIIEACLNDSDPVISAAAATR